MTIPRDVLELYDVSRLFVTKALVLSIQRCPCANQFAVHEASGMHGREALEDVHGEAQSLLE